LGDSSIKENVTITTLEIDSFITKEELENYKQEYNISWYVAFASDSMAFATLLISLSRDALLKKIKNATDLIKKVASVIIILVGIYLLLEFFVLS